MHGVVTLYYWIDQSQSLFSLLRMFSYQTMLLYRCEDLSQPALVLLSLDLKSERLTLRKSNRITVESLCI